ncbi:MAG: hypothetical protein WCA79_16840 [Anaerolineales bacterium]
MAKIIVYLGEQERNTLNQLAQREIHVPRAMTALVIHQEPVRQGMLDERTKAQRAEFSLELGAEGQSR